MEEVWLVWTESGEYESWSRDLRGVFATKELADGHAAQLGEGAEVHTESVMTTIPKNVPYIEWSAHIDSLGREDTGLGYGRGAQCRTWSNEISDAAGRISEWNRRQSDDLYVEVVGSDAGAVEAEYARLLTIARAIRNDVAAMREP